MSALDDQIAREKSFDAPNASMGSAADYYNGPTQAAPTPYVAPSAGTPPPAPFVPPPNVQTPPQAANSGFAPIPGNTPIIAQPTKGAPAPTLTVPATSINPTPGSALPGKGYGKGPSSMQTTAQPNMSTMPDTPGNPMDFHQQLQDFINSGLLGGSQRLQG